MALGTESHYPHDWLLIAAKDLQRVAKRLAERDIDDAAFRLQQAVEKFLKGYLLAQGWKLRRIHDIEALLTDATRYDPGLERYRTLCQQATGYYLIERYPTFEEGPSLEEVRAAYAEARTLARYVRGHLKRRGRS